MQMYEKEGCYKEQHVAAVEDDYAFKGELCDYSKGSSMQMTKPGYGGYGGGHNGQFGGYGGGHNGQFGGYGGGHGAGQFKHSYGQSHGGYGGAGHAGQFQQSLDKQHGYGSFNKHHGGGDGYSEEYSESWYEEERRANMRNDYSAHGGKQHYPQNGGMKAHTGYAGHGGQFGPHQEQKYKYSEKYEEKRGAPVWNFKSITD